MFGYVSADKNELKVIELADYNACYCGLCRSISNRYGQAARATLNYDCAFASMLLCGLKGEREAKPSRCGYKPFSKKRVIAEDSPSFQFGADIEIALAWYKLCDDWQDEKKAVALFGKAGLYGAFKKLKALSPQVAQTVERGIASLSKLEKANCTEIDAVANTFAKMMQDLAKLAPLEDDKELKVFSHLMFSLGRWIYLMDAWEDREKDKKHGLYNPFCASNKDSDKENAAYLLHSALNKAIDAYDLLELKTHKGVLDNIMYSGCVMRTEKLLGGNDEQSL